MTTYYIIRKSEGIDLFKVYIATQNGDMMQHKQGKNYGIKELNSFIETARARGDVLKIEQDKTLESMTQ